MSVRLFVGAVVAVGAIGFLAGLGFSEEEPPNEAELMEQMLKLGQPGPEHEIFKSMAGEWTTVAKNFMNPEKPEVTTGRATNTLVLGGRYLHQRFSGTWSGKRHVGSGFLGHDNWTRKYQNMWVDNFSSGMMIVEGTGSEDGKSIDLTYEWDGPMGKMNGRIRYTITGRDSHVIEGWMMMGEQEVKSMEVVYTRLQPRGRGDCR